MSVFDVSRKRLLIFDNLGMRSDVSFIEGQKVEVDAIKRLGFIMLDCKRARIIPRG